MKPLLATNAKKEESRGEKVVNVFWGRNKKKYQRGGKANRERWTCRAHERNP